MKTLDPRCHQMIVAGGSQLHSTRLPPEMKRTQAPKNATSRALKGLLYVLAWVHAESGTTFTAERDFSMSTALTRGALGDASPSETTGPYCMSTPKYTSSASTQFIGGVTARTVNQGADFSPTPTRHGSESKHPLPKRVPFRERSIHHLLTIRPLRR